jgi:hypothetical protein
MNENYITSPLKKQKINATDAPWNKTDTLIKKTTTTTNKQKTHMDRQTEKQKHAHKF